ncbi:DNA-processing protein DprA, partial [Flavobacterium sp.]|uniref:DNA-processing protein DprA n=1 Tax=Flavobacterium sp. TaxID=239 RepID=UPI0025C60984
MRHEELFYLLALQNVEGVGDVNAKKLLSEFGSAREIFNADDAKLRTIGFSEKIIGHLKSTSVLKQAEAEMNFIESSKIKVATYLDDDYPKRLKHCPDAPTVLFSSGNIDLSNRRIISVVGTRQVTGYGADFCKKLMSDLSPLNPIIVSGYALGVDITA